jgi:hypothetical protein
MGRKELSVDSLTVNPGQITHLQLESDSEFSMKTLWIQRDAVVYLYAERYVSRPSILNVDTLLIDPGGTLYIVPGDPEREHIVLGLGKSSSLVLLSYPSDLDLLLEIMAREVEIYRSYHRFLSDIVVGMPLIARTLLRDDIRIQIYGE